VTEPALRRNLLVLAYSFPPSAAIATHRSLAFVKYLQEHGWRSLVLSAENPVYPARDDALVARIPPSAQVVRTVDRDWLSVLQPIYQRLRGRRDPSALSNTGGAPAQPSGVRRLANLIALHLRPPGVSPGWYRSTLHAARAIMAQHHIDAIFSSGPPWSSHLVALRLANQFRLPWVADFRDQWIADPFDEPPTPPSVVWRDRRAERRVMQRADVAICVVDTLRDVLRSRYPERAAADIITVMNGYDPDILEGISLDGDQGPGAGKLELLHAGHFYGKRRIEPLLAASEEWLARDPALRPAFRISVLGGAPDYLEELRARIAAAGSPEYVQLAGEISHHESIQLQARASVLLLVGFAGPGAETQMSGKIFEYLAVRRPILALAPPESPVGQVLRASGCSHWIVSPDNHAGLVQALTEIGQAWREGNLKTSAATASLAAFSRREQTRQLAQTLDLAIAKRAAART
jgi:hypothetical protein